MMSTLVWILLTLLILVLVAAAAVAFRYRRHIQGAWLMWNTFRRMKKQASPKKKEVGEKAGSGNSLLVSCAKCGNWVPQNDAVKLKSNFYCSHRCLEESFVNTG